ncbi:MAG: hypothetical protein FD122_1231 [Stygiobacter sp.]|nr:MAG: hypothetical protein FD122_1231 [Stygiobacter sp.]KAF0218190.1 MAG: hypothetical protein FD178_70 [Ignavibacteria bacterium]
MNMEQCSLKIGLISVLLLFGCKTEKEKMLSLGDEKFFAGDFKGASKIYNEVKKKHPDYLLTYIRIADCELCISKSYPAFIGNLNQAKAVDKEFVSYLNNEPRSFNYVFVSINEEERRTKLLGYSNEIEFLTEAIAKNKNNDNFYFARGMWHFFLDESEKAIQDFETAATKNKNFLEAQLMLARIYSNYYKSNRGNGLPVNSKYVFKALRIYLQALNSNPNSEKIINETALCFNRVGQNQTALKIAEEAYLKDTSKTILLSQLVWLNRITGNINKANKYIVKLVQKSPDNKWYLENYAQVLIELGEIDNGINILKRIKEEVKDNKYEALRIQGIIDVNTINRQKINRN